MFYVENLWNGIRAWLLSVTQCSSAWFERWSSSILQRWARHHLGSVKGCRATGGCHPKEGKFWGFTVSAWASLGAKLVCEVGISQKCAFALWTRNLQGFTQNLRPLVQTCSCLRVRLPLDLSPGIFSLLSQYFWGYSALFGVLTWWPTVVPSNRTHFVISLGFQVKIWKSAFMIPHLRLISFSFFVSFLSKSWLCFAWIQESKF